LRGTFTLIDDDVFQIVRKVHISGIRNTFQSGYNFFFDLVPSESASLANKLDYEFCYAALGYPFKGHVNRKLYEDE
jgi:hypothetical protein